MSLDVTEIIADAVRRNPECSEAITSVSARLLDAQPQRAARPESLGAPQEERRSKIRTVVRITRCGIRLLDCDNGTGGCKALLDALRYEKIIEDDDPETIDFIFAQKKVKRAEIGTEILIQYYAE